MHNRTGKMIPKASADLDISSGERKTIGPALAHESQPPLQSSDVLQNQHQSYRSDSSYHQRVKPDLATQQSSPPHAPQPKFSARSPFPSPTMRKKVINIANLKLRTASLIDTQRPVVQQPKDASHYNDSDPTRPLLFQGVSDDFKKRISDNTTRNSFVGRWEGSSRPPLDESEDDEIDHVLSAGTDSPQSSGSFEFDISPMTPLPLSYNFASMTLNGPPLDSHHNPPSVTITHSHSMESQKPPRPPSIHVGGGGDWAPSKHFDRRESNASTMSHSSGAVELFGSFVGSYEESILSGRMSTLPSKPIPFIAEIGVVGFGKCKSGLKCPPHLCIDFAAFFYEWAEVDGVSPYVGFIELDDGRFVEGPIVNRRSSSEVALSRAAEDLNITSRISNPHVSVDSAVPESKKLTAYRLPLKGQLQIVRNHSLQRVEGNETDIPFRCLK